MVMPFSFSSSMESMVAPTSSLPRTCAQPLARQQNAIKKMSKHGAAHTYTHTYTHTHTHMRERVCRWWWSTDLVHFFDAASVEEDALGQGGFARVNVGRDANVANLLNGVCCGREGNGERGEERECVCVCVCVCYALPHHTHTHTHTHKRTLALCRQTDRRWTWLQSAEKEQGDGSHGVQQRQQLLPGATCRRNKLRLWWCAVVRSEQASAGTQRNRAMRE